MTIQALVFVIVAGSACAATDPGVLRLGQGSTAYEKRDFPSTVRLLSTSGQPAKLRDYVAYYLANSEILTNDTDGAVRDLGRYATNPVPASPLAGRLTLLYAKALLGEHNPASAMASAAKARQMLQADYALLPQPDGDQTLAQAFEATGFPRQAANYYQRVYYLYPAADLAEKARTALERLQSSLAADFPSVTPRQQLDRAAAMLKAKQYSRARQEYGALALDLTGGDRDEAQAGVGASFYLEGDYAGTARYLGGLRLSAADPAAARLYYLTEANRHLNDDEAMMDAIRQLGEQYPQSPWRLKALVSAGNRYLLTQDRAQYVPLYEAAAASFPGDSTAALCHWRVVWAAWLDHSPRRVRLLQEQVEKFPGDTHTSDALFFLARAAEQNSNFSMARVYYERLNTFYPHYYFGGLARERLTDPKIASAKADADTRLWVQVTADAAHSAVSHPDLTAIPGDATRQRIDRGRLLMLAGMTTQAVEELEYGAKQDNEQPTVLAMELSRAMPTPYLAVKVMKKYSGDYLSLPFDQASRAFWEMLFPLPYQSDLTASSTALDLDPFAVAGLIRQESEFNPGAHSPANAYGLMQLIPSTGRALGRKEGIRVSSTSMLLNPTLNIKLGTQYLRGQLNSWDGDWVRTLAAYNAGPTRVKNWVNQYGYTDSAEFIENIPFSETRDYVQAVLRNGQVYRELYGKQKAPVAAEVADTSSVPPVRMTNVALVSKSVSKKPARRPAKKAVAKKTGTKPVAVASTRSKKTSATASAGSKSSKKRPPA
jgi:soluble lytic murein transglycosylase